MADPYEIDLPSFPDKNGLLVTLEEGIVPFAPRRTFVVLGVAGTSRGRHAHRTCTQLLVCLTGKVEVTTDSAVGRRTFELDSPTEGLMLPPMTWAEQHYLAADSVLLVVCDKTFDENDYIRDYQAYVTLAQS